MRHIRSTQIHKRNIMFLSKPWRVCNELKYLRSVIQVRGRLSGLLMWVPNTILTSHQLKVDIEEPHGATTGTFLSLLHTHSTPSNRRGFASEDDKMLLHKIAPTRHVRGTTVSKNRGAIFAAMSGRRVAFLRSVFGIFLTSPEPHPPTTPLDTHAHIFSPLDFLLLCLCLRLMFGTPLTSIFQCRSQDKSFRFSARHAQQIPEISMENELNCS